MADQCIQSNPDVAGIGIRFNFYFTVLVAILTREKDHTEELLSGLYKNSVINGLAVLFTAVIQTSLDKLDLYHAVVVMYILFFFNIVFLFGQRRFVWSSQTDFQMYIYLLVHAFGVIVFLVWFLYAAIDSNKFGSQPSCNHLVKFVIFFFFNVRVTAPWFRAIMILFFALTIPLLLFILGFLLFAPAGWTKACTETIDAVFKKFPWLGALFRYVLGFPLVVYIIVNLELIIYRNRAIIQPGENEWGFGQIIAIVMTLGIFMDMVVALRRLWTSPHQNSSSA